MSNQTPIYGNQGGTDLTIATGGRLLFSGGFPVFTVSAKTADYTVVAADVGKIFTTRGAAGAVTFTLPTVASVAAGSMVMFVNLVGQNMTVAAAADSIITFNDVDADSVSLQTANELIGGAFLAISDGTSWIILHLCNEVQTVTVAT